MYILYTLFYNNIYILFDIMEFYFCFLLCLNQSYYITNGYRVY